MTPHPPLGSSPDISPGGAACPGFRVDKPQKFTFANFARETMNIQFDTESMTSEQLAQCLSITFPDAMTTEDKTLSVRAVQKWAKDGMPHRFAGKDLRYTWPSALAWFLQNKHRGPVAQSKGSTTPAKADSEARILDVRARREEMRLAKEEGRLVPVEQIEPAWLRVAETVKNRVLTLPPKAKEALPHLSTDDVKVLHRLCREALEELSRCPATGSR